MYLLGLLLTLLALSPSDRALTPVRRRHIDEVPGWMMILAQLQFSAVYGFTALAKVNDDFVSGLALNTFTAPFAREHLVPASLLSSDHLFVGLSTAAIVVELFAAIGSRFSGRALLLLA